MGLVSHQRLDRLGRNRLVWVTQQPWAFNPESPHGAGLSHWRWGLEPMDSVVQPEVVWIPVAWQAGKLGRGRQPEWDRWSGWCGRPPGQWSSPPIDTTWHCWTPPGQLLKWLCWAPATFWWAIVHRRLGSECRTPPPLFHPHNYKPPAITLKVSGCVTGMWRVCSLVNFWHSRKQADKEQTVSCHFLCTRKVVSLGPWHHVTTGHHWSADIQIWCDLPSVPHSFGMMLFKSCDKFFCFGTN